MIMVQVIYTLINAKFNYDYYSAVMETSFMKLQNMRQHFLVHPSLKKILEAHVFITLCNSISFSNPSENMASSLFFLHHHVDIAMLSPVNLWASKSCGFDSYVQCSTRNVCSSFSLLALIDI